MKTSVLGHFKTAVLLCGAYDRSKQLCRLTRLAYVCLAMGAARVCNRYSVVFAHALEHLHACPRPARRALWRRAARYPAAS